MGKTRKTTEQLVNQRWRTRRSATVSLQQAALLVSKMHPEAWPQRSKAAAFDSADGIVFAWREEVSQEEVKVAGVNVDVETKNTWEGNIISGNVRRALEKAFSTVSGDGTINLSFQKDDEEESDPGQWLVSW